MKTILTEEQSRKLFELGIGKLLPYNLAIHTGKEVYAPNGESFPDPNGYYVRVEMYDLLMILPKVLHKEGLAYDYNLDMCWQEDVKEWRVTYDAIGDNLGSESAPELIDALYKLAIKTLSDEQANTD